jgi:translation initiation factor IF-2
LAKQLRVHQLAKELGVASKAIVDKCQAEDVAAITNHMSVVTAGLAASIREWFSEGEHGTTVETAEPVDLKKVRRRRRKTDHKASAASVAEPEETAEPAPTREEAGVATPEAQQDQPTAAQQVPDERVASQAAVLEEPAAAPVEAQVLGAPPEAPAPPGVEPPSGEAVPTEPAVAAAPAAPEGPTVTPEALPVGEQVSQPTAAAEATRRRARREHARPPRPQMVAPAPAQIKGPRVVRVERPEPARPLRAGPRRVSAGSAAAMGSAAPEVLPETARRGRGRKTAAEEAEDERRKKARAKGKKGGTKQTEQVVEHLREWRDRDLLERQERLQSATGRGLHARRAAESRRVAGGLPHVPAARKTKAQVTEPISVKALCAAIGHPFSAVFQNLMAKGQMVRINDSIDSDTAQLVSMELGVELDVVARKTALQRLEAEFGSKARRQLVRRNPVVTFLGHVDHGKTSLLDRIRNARVAEGEAGGITQHLGAYRLEHGGRSVTFLDTPGHAAFTALRARGANLTDIAVLVVAADDGVMPQTVEAINHARAADVPIVVALNKIDLPGVDVNRIYGQLAEHGLVPGEWGGDTDIIKTSAVTGQGVDELVEHLHTLGEVLDLKADPSIAATGAVVETSMEEGTGSVACVLVQDGTLHVGDVMVCGTAQGRVRSMTDDLGRRVAEAGPGVPVVISGLDELPAPGEKFYVVETLKQAMDVAEERRREVREDMLAASAKPTSLEALLQQREAGQLPELNVIIKADVLGSVEVLKKTLGELPADKARLRILHAAAGGIVESDVLLADASHAVVVGFNVVPEPAAQRLAEQKNVTIRLYRVIYDLTDALRRSLQGLLEPEKRMENRGRAEVREVFKITKVGAVAGCYVTDGVIMRSHKVRIIRDSVVIRDESTMESLRRFKDDVREVRQGMECGIKIANFDDIKAGDVIESYEIVEVARLL